MHPSIELARERFSYFKDIKMPFKNEQDYKQLIEECLNICNPPEYIPEKELFSLSSVYYYDVWERDDVEMPGMIIPLMTPVEKIYQDFSLAIGFYVRGSELYVTSILSVKDSMDFKISFEVCMITKNKKNLQSICREVIDRTVTELQYMGILSLQELDS